MNTNEELCLPISIVEAKVTELLGKMNYSQNTINDYSKVIRYIKESQQSTESVLYSKAVGNRWLNELQQRGASTDYYRHCRGIVLRLNDIVEGREFVKNHTFFSYDVPNEFEGIFQDYIGYLNAQHTKENTIRNKMLYACEFFKNLYTLGCRSVEDITGVIISKASIMNSAHNYPGVMRSVLKYLLDIDKIHCDYSCLIRKVKKKQPIPTVYSKNEIRQIEHTPDISSLMGKRDRAMILLSTRNGLRAGNIVGLKLSDIDFDNDIMHLKQVKTTDSINPVLLPDVKTALLDYINNGRPEVDSDIVFLTTVAPYTPMHPGDVRHVTYKAIHEADIEINGRKCGPHAMRSSLNSAGVNNGITYEEMRIIDGHKDPNAIKHYARLDDVNLRKCALDVNAPTGFFERFLRGEEVLPNL